MDPLPSNAACWPALSSSSDIGFCDRFAVEGLGPEGSRPAPRCIRSLLARSGACGLPPVVVPAWLQAIPPSHGILPPGLVADGVGIDVLGAGGNCRGHYDPYSTLERIGSSEDLRSVSDNRLFVIDRTPQYESPLMLESAGSNAGYLGDSHSYFEYSSDSVLSLPGPGTSVRPSSRLAVAHWYAPPRVPLVRDMAVQAWGPDVRDEQEVTEHCGRNWRCFQGLSYCHFGSERCYACLAQEGDESVFCDSDQMCPEPIELPLGGYLGDHLRTFSAVAGGPSSVLALRSDPACSLDAVFPYEHHSDASEARFGGGAWYVGEISYPPSAAREVHLDPRGCEDYDCGEEFPAAPASPDIPPAAGGAGGEA